MEYEIRVEACTFVSPLLHLWQRVHRLLQLLCLFKCSNAEKYNGHEGKLVCRKTCKKINRV
jgi:hypothetical protein